MATTESNILMSRKKSSGDLDIMYPVTKKENILDLEVVTDSSDGLMLAADKAKLNGIEEGANKTIIDSALSETSKNPLQNDVTTKALNDKANKSHKHSVSDITDFPESLPASDVSEWAKAATKPKYTASEVGADASGSANTALTNAKSYTDTKIADLINGAPSTLDTLGEIAKAMENNQSVVEALNDAIGTKANESDLTSHTGNKSNPHGVTKAQIGLGNVPNVATNDQTPSYTEATTLAKLSSGEKLSVAFGKISKAITDLISHIGDSAKHITSTERTNWNAKASTAVATASTNGLMSSSSLSKLNGIESGAIKVHKALTSNGTTATTTKGYTYGVAGVTTSPYNYTKWYAYLDSGVTTLTNGMIISIKIPVAGCNYGCCVSIDGGTTFKPVVYNSNSIVTGHYGTGVELLLMYDSNFAASVWSNSSSAAAITGVWRIMNMWDSGNTISSAMCYTAAGTAAKTATFSSYTLLAKSYFMICITYSNTAKSALTLNINNRGAKPIRINGAASSSSNYTLPAGTYIVYYTGTDYCFRTDGKLPANVSGNADTATKLTTARTISLTGSVTGSGSFDGSGNLSIATTTNHSHPVATSSANGFMSSTDKAKLDSGYVVKKDSTGIFIEV